MKQSNTQLWDSVFNTDPAHTKGFKRTGGFSGTAIKPLYLIHKATQLWGSMGDKWGAETAEHTVHGNTIFMKARLWYPGDTGKAWVEHWGGDVLVKGDKPNDEAFKMAFTDAVGKCLVQLGFSADVHMGLFDDSKYLAEQKKVSSAAENRKFKGFLKALEESDDPTKFWADNLVEINEYRNDPEPGAVENTMLKSAHIAILALIENADDPAEVWGKQQRLISKMETSDGARIYFDTLKKAASERRDKLEAA